MEPVPKDVQTKCRRLKGRLAASIAIVTLLFGLQLLFLEWQCGILTGPYYYIELCLQAETGYRLAYFNQLARSGQCGTRLARRYAASRFNSLRPYGTFFVTASPGIWIGLDRASLIGWLGLPDVEQEGTDSWLIELEYVGTRSAKSFLTVRYEHSLVVGIKREVIEVKRDE